MSFVVGIPHLFHRALLFECLEAIERSISLPERVIVIDNGGSLENLSGSVDVVWPEENLGTAGSWNLLHQLARPKPLVLLNDDCTVAANTFERMLADPALVVLAWGFSCFLLREPVWKIVGEFDEEFYPAYWEDCDYRYRCRLSDVDVSEWSTEPRVAIESEDGRRERAPSGIVHGKHEEGAYQGWRDDEFRWFHERLEANRRRYIKKWGGESGHERFLRPFQEST